MRSTRCRDNLWGNNGDGSMSVDRVHCHFILMMLEEDAILKPIIINDNTDNIIYIILLI